MALSAKEHRERSKAKLKAYIASQKTKPCTDCGETYPPHVMQFDHLGDKHFIISAAHKSYGFAKIKAEIAKCEVVCANCHAKRTYARVDKHSPPVR